MATLEPLIRYRKHLADEKQRTLARLYREAETLEQKKKTLYEEMDQETEKVESHEPSSEEATDLARYLEGVRGRIEVIDRDLTALNTLIEVAQEDMREAFSEMKKAEIVHRNREDRAEAAQKKKEEQELDEVAIEGFRRGEE